MNKKYITAGYAFLFSLLLIVGSIYISPIFGLINPWMIIPLAPLAYIIATQKDLATTMLIVVGLVVFGFIEVSLTTNTAAWKYDFQGIGAAYFVLPVLVSVYLTYYIVNTMYLSTKNYSEEKIITWAIISIITLSSLTKIVMFALTDTIYGGTI